MKPTLFKTAVLAVAIATGSAHAASEQQVAELGKSLTPIGAEKAGNAAGTIPEWDGGLAPDAGELTDGFGPTPMLVSSLSL